MGEFAGMGGGWAMAHKRPVVGFLFGMHVTHVVNPHGELVSVAICTTTLMRPQKLNLVTGKLEVGKWIGRN